ncbi:MAG: phosphate signaling complex protein PhoU [Ignavibacteriae bacterium]|nr:phosphate signaling complex protein PhoU [Ignavibacteriota bacterium]
MQRHFVQELEMLKTNLVKMASFAEQAIADSIAALLERRKDIAEQVIARDKRINSLEIQIDDAVVDLLALQQPVATDLRFILAALKINNDLERIGDHAVNIAESALQCAKLPSGTPLTNIPEMAEITKKMLRDAIDGFIHSNAGLGRAVLKGDDTIDDLNKKIVNDLVAVIRNEPNSIDEALDLIRVSRNLERVADLATNIAEEVIFMAEARVVKHHVEESPLSQ